MPVADEEQGSGDDSTSVESHFHLPPPELEGCFTSFFRLKLRVPGNAVLSDFMMPDWASMRFFDQARPMATLGKTALSGTRMVCSGASTLAGRFTIGTTNCWGVGFMPLGWARFFDSDADELANTAVDGEQHPAFARFAGLADILCTPDVGEDAQYAALVECLQDIAREHPDEDRIRLVHRVLLDEQVGKVTEFADRADMSVRSLERICCRYFGFSPKVLLRRQRFIRSLSAFMLQEGAMWTKTMDAHYHDQAQFSREFVKFMGVTPSEYAAMDHPFLKSFIAARARMLGSPAQTLDKPD